MRFTATLAVGLLAGLAGSSARGSGFGLNEHSARAMAMAGAYTAIAEGPAAAFFNPAGLATLRGLQLEAGLSFVAPSSSYRGLAPELGVETTLDMNKKYFYLPNFHAGWRIHERVAVGLGVFVPYGLTTEWPSTVNVGGQNVGWWGRAASERISLTTLYITPQVAVNLHPRIQLGGGLYVVRGVTDLRRAISLGTNPADDININLAASAWGYSGSAGLLIAAIPGLLNAGFTYRGGVRLNFEGNATFTKPDGSPNVPTGQSSQLTDGPASSTIRMPHVFSFGLAAFPIKPLTIGLSFDVSTWSDFKELAINFSPLPDAPNRPQLLNSVTSKNWSNSIAVRVGGEYRVVPRVAVRAGFIYDQSPIPRTTVGPDLPDADRYELTLGAGAFLWDGLRLDLAYQFLTTGSFRSADVSPVPGSWSTSAHLLGLTIGYAVNL